jgi:hypothetical protein
MFGKYGGRYRIRTCDFHRVNFEVVNLKPFACLAFPLLLLRENALKRLGFGDELVTSSSAFGCELAEFHISCAREISKE